MQSISQPTILLVKKLPVDLNEAEIRDLLEYFGALSVSIMSSKGHMKGCAFAEFRTSEEAEIALRKLHQAPLFNSRLVVEYSDKNYMPVEPPDPQKIIQTAKLPESPKIDVPHQPDPSLHYLYPPPTPHSLNNISHALITVPLFYVQVLHLMNKMNLPPPFLQSSEKSIFEQTESAPPPLPSSSESELESEEEAVDEIMDKEKEIYEEKRLATQAFLDKHLDVSDRKRKRHISCEEKSAKRVVADSCSKDVTNNIHSSVIETHTALISEQKNTGTVQNVQLVSNTVTNSSSEVERDLNKKSECKLKLSENTKSYTEPSVISRTTKPVNTTSQEIDMEIESEDEIEIDIKDLPSTASESVKQTIGIPGSFGSRFPPPPPPGMPPTMFIPATDTEQLGSDVPVTCAKQAINPGQQYLSQEGHDSDSQNVPGKSSVQQTNIDQNNALKKHRSEVKLKCLPSDELEKLPVFKKYSPGDPSQKLYIKNLNHKAVTQEDLMLLFRPYFDIYKTVDKPDSQLEIKLMTEGRMKGQAFVLLPSVECSQLALSDLHGYVLKEKPMAIMFAKSK